MQLIYHPLRCSDPSFLTCSCYTPLPEFHDLKSGVMRGSRLASLCDNGGFSRRLTHHTMTYTRQHQTQTGRGREDD